MWINVPLMVLKRQSRIATDKSFFTGSYENSEENKNWYIKRIIFNLETTLFEIRIQKSCVKRTLLNILINCKLELCRRG